MQLEQENQCLRNDIEDLRTTLKINKESIQYLIEATTPNDLSLVKTANSLTKENVHLQS